MLEAILVLGFSLNPDCTQHPLQVLRLEAALGLYKPGIPMILCGKMPLEIMKPDRCIEKTEAKAMQEYLLEKGVLKNDLYLEELSMTTFTNAYYARLLHLDPLKIKSVTVVSNEFHMDLIQYIFKKILGKDIAFKTHAASNNGAKVEEITNWKTLFKKMVDEVYPILFADIADGNLKSIHPFVNGVKNAENKNKWEMFSSNLKNLLGIEDKVFEVVL